MARGDTQYQQWLTEQEGLSSLAAQRSRRAVLEDADGLEEDIRERRQNRIARNDDGTGMITQKYLAYFSEANPTKRAILLRDYTPNDEPGAADDGKAPAARRGRAGGAAGRDPLEKAGDDRSGRRIPPAPALPGASRGTGRSTRRPSDVLDRSRRLDDGDNADSPRSPATKRSDRRLPATPATDD